MPAVITHALISEESAKQFPPNLLGAVRKHPDYFFVLEIYSLLFQEYQSPYPIDILHIQVFEAQNHSIQINKETI